LDSSNQRVPGSGAKDDLKTSSYPREWDGLKMKVSFGMSAPAHIPWIAFIAPEMQVSKDSIRAR
jgi:hypothetical protein